MLVETRPRDPDAAAAAPGPTEAPDAGPALRDLIAAGLVSTEAIGDPDRLPGGETAALAAICRQVAGPVYRLAPFHYAFAAGPAPAATLAAALAAELGPEALWLGPTAILDPAPAAEAPPAAALLLMRAREAAVAAGLAAAGPGVQAVVDAAWAADCARLVAGAAPGAPLDRRLAGIEAALAAFETARAATAPDADPDAALGLALARLAAATDRAAEAAARLEALRDTIALTLAEFLARLERRAAADAP
jgi:hypothetical protein